MKRSRSEAGHDASATSGTAGSSGGWSDHKSFPFSTSIAFAAGTASPPRGSNAPSFTQRVSAAISRSDSFPFGGIAKSGSR